MKLTLQALKLQTHEQYSNQPFPAHNQREIDRDPRTLHAEVKNKKQLRANPTHKTSGPASVEAAIDS